MSSAKLGPAMKRFRPPSSSSYREALIVAVVWTITCVYTVGYAALFAYRDSASRVVLGIPSWVVWGVLLPWVVTLFVTLWFAGAGMKDEPLGENPDEVTDGE